MKMELGRFIDDIRKEIKWFNVNFEPDPFGEQMTITFPPKTTISYVVSDWKLGEIEYGSPQYKELLELTLEHLREMSKNK
jgi:hypothetical protein